MRRVQAVLSLIVLGGVGALALGIAGHRAATAAVGGTRTPVIVELFTSEGCSSCPPADAELKRLKEEQPVPGAQVIALSEHVDYWNHLGWADPFSSAAFSARQSDYAQALRLPEVYTPQEVVDGQTEFVGSDRGRAEEAITRAARVSKRSVQLAWDRAATDEPTLRVQIDPLAAGHEGETADVMLAITEDNLKSNVTRGENAGNRLGHTAVVRQLRRIGTVKPSDRFTATSQLVLNSGWKRRDLNAVVFVQERTRRHILGAAILPLAN